jgi:hypothetical protein
MRKGKVICHKDSALAKVTVFMEAAGCDAEFVAAMAPGIAAAIERHDLGNGCLLEANEHNDIVSVQTYEPGNPLSISECA